ncbi:MAG TPA: hypothetical protein VGF69_18080 [Thermoanaerobaculia bacterium]|jgi:hypothetical protein
MNDEKNPIAIPLEHLKSTAAAVAEQMKSGALTPELREKFINVRAALFQRGIYDPVLVRFDSATVSQASVQEIGEQLSAVAEAI